MADDVHRTLITFSDESILIRYCIMIISSIILF